MSTAADSRNGGVHTAIITLEQSAIYSFGMLSVLVGHSTLKALITACNLMPASRAKATDGLQESRKKRVYAQVFDAKVS